MMETIEFEGITYPAVLIKLPFGERKIGTEELNEKLMSFDGSYASEKARVIDERIFYFVPEKNLSIEENKLVKLILSEL